MARNPTCQPFALAPAQHSRQKTLIYTLRSLLPRKPNSRHHRALSLHNELFRLPSVNSFQMQKADHRKTETRNVKSEPESNAISIQNPGEATVTPGPQQPHGALPQRNPKGRSNQTPTAFKGPDRIRRKADLGVAVC